MKTSWLASIRTKIFFGCISLAFVTIFVSMVSQGAQVKLSGTASGIYDNAFTSMSYLRSAQSNILGISRDLALGDKNTVVFVDQLQSTLDALDVARERAMSPRGEEATKVLQAGVLELQAALKEGSGPPTRRQFVALEQKFDVAVDIFAGDGFRLRRSVEALVQQTRLLTYVAMVVSIVVAFAITLMLSKAIVPSIRHAVGIAVAIADGQLDIAIDMQGRSETGHLMKALAAMKDSIADKIACIETLMARQATTYAAEIACQHARFEAALNNMKMGLCMFDAGDALLVRNRRFVEMFGPADSENSVHAPAQLRGPPASDDQATTSRSFSCLLDDGRTIAVSEESMDGGGRVVTYEDITERQRSEARLFHMARHDALTGLPNRVVFREWAERELAHVGRGGALAVLCLDLDRFKTVNDTLGHPVGDALLREASIRLLDTAGEADAVFRLGGDEFAVIRHSERRGDEARILADRLICALSIPFDIDGHRISIGASIGIAETVDGSESPDYLLKNADLALYLAKADGRGTYRFFEREMDERIQAKRKLELDLLAAIAERQFEVFYQPLLNATTGEVVSFEALIRWRHPERGLVSPAEFIPLAEETGLILTLGLWVLDQACHDAVDWPQHVKVAVNLSPLQFQRQNLVGAVTDALRRSGLHATRLELEITESLMLQDTAATLATLHDLRGLGVKISMDDFGTGYSSLSYLRRFPFDKIKIDQSFIRNMEENSDGLAIVSAVIGLGRSLRMNVVAEGVETKEQKDLLCKAGCQEMQGYLFSPPQPIAAVKALIERFALSCAA